MKIYITRKIAEPAVNLLKKKKFEVKIFSGDQPVPREELIENVKGSDAVISLLTEKFDAELIDQMDHCRIISNLAVGYNNIDIKYARKKRIVVTNTPDVLTDSTADLAVALLLACTRRLREGEDLLRRGVFKGWNPQLLLGTELKDKIMGIIGAGKIGTAVALRAKAFGVKIVYHSLNQNKLIERKASARRLPLNTCLRQSDIVSLHVPLTPRTYHLLNEKRLSLLKKNAVIINTARGEIIDEKVLIRMLKEKKIYAAGLDVYENEPELNPELFTLENAVLLPHIGSATEEARGRMAFLAVRNVINVLSGRKPLTPVRS